TIANITGVAGATFTAPRTITLDAPRTVGTLNLSSNQSVTLDGASTLTLNNSGAATTLNSSGANHFISAPLALTAGGAFADIADSTTLTLSGDVSGTGVGIVKSGNGTLLLTANTTYTGATSVAAGTLQIGNGGTSGSVTGSIATSGVLRFNRSDSVTLGSVISGTGSVEFIGTGDTTLSANNTYSGNTTLSAGSLVLNTGLGLQNSRLNYLSGGGTLIVQDPVLAITLGALSGDKAIPLTNTLGTPLALTVGGNGGSTTYSGSPAGTGTTFTKTGSGTFSVGGTHTYSGAGLVSAGVLGIETGADFSVAGTFSLSTTTGAGLTVNGGNFTATGLTTITNSSAGITINGGIANLNGGIINTASDAGLNFVNVNGGTLNTSSINLRRHGANSSTTEPTGGSASNGLYIHGGATAAVHVTGALDLGVNTNSGVSGRMDSGSLTVDGAVTVAISSPDRWTVLDINGGTFTANNTVNGVLLGGNITAGNVIMHVRGTGVANVPRIQFGQGALGGKSYLNLNDTGALYVGSGGLSLGTTEPTFLAGIRLKGGILGASADWISTIPVVISGTPAVVTGADASDVAHTINLQGTVSGVGSLTKNGSGTVLLSSPANGYQGPTIVNGGTLGIAGLTTQAITVNANGALTPLGALTAELGGIINGRLNISYNATPTTTTVSSITSTVDTLVLGASSTLVISGTGTLNAQFYVLLKGVDPLFTPGAPGVIGTFASVTGVPSGYALNYAYDDDANTTTPPVVALVAVPSDPYTVWADSFPTLTDRLLGSDPDADGLTNLQEYAFVTSPVASDSADAYTFGRTGNNLTLTFDHPADTSLTYAVQASTDLTGAWSVVNTFAPFTTAGNATYTDTADLTVTPRRFLRLSVTKAP
ncbi:MAG: hypothetical protein RIQ79_1435, partial [Verrucomicrobiota bacterium]